MRLNLKPLEAIIISLSLLGELASLSGIIYSYTNYTNLMNNPNSNEIKAKANDYLIYGAASTGTALASGIFLSQGIIRRRNRIMGHWRSY